MLTIDQINNIAGVDGMKARAYTDPEIFDLEMDRIFRCAWIFIGHDSQVPNSGDFKRTRMGADEILLVRQIDGSLRAQRILFASPR